MGPGDTLETLDSSKIVAAAVTTVEAVLAAVGVDSGAAVSGPKVPTFQFRRPHQLICTVLQVLP